MKKIKTFIINVNNENGFCNNAYLDTIKAFSYKLAFKKAKRKYGNNIRIKEVKANES